MTSNEQPELRILLSLALPLAAAQAGNQLMGFVDTAMVGRIGTASIGGVGIGNGLFFAFTCFGLGVVLGMDAPTAQALGAGEMPRARLVLSRGLRVAFWLALPLTACVLLSPLGLGPAGVEPGTAHETARFLHGRAAGVLPFLLFVALRSHLQARALTRSIIIATVVGNAVNVALNVPLIFGDRALVWLGLPPLGLPPLGALGSGISSAVAGVTMAAVLALAVRAALQGAGPAADPAEGPALQRTILRLGVPAGLQLVAEVAVFATVALLAGRLGRDAAAAHQIAITLASFTFTIALGVAQATSVRVGHHVGAGDTAHARHAGLVGIGVGVGIMAASALTFVCIPEPLARLFSSEPAVVAAAAPLIRIAACFQIFDGIQVVAAGALRGAGDTRLPLYANLFGYYAVALPLAIALGVLGPFGAAGLWWGLCAGLVVVSALLLWRFLRVSARPIARM